MEQATNDRQSELVVNSMAILSQGKEGECYPLGFQTMDDKAHDQFTTFLKIRKVNLFLVLC